MAEQNKGSYSADDFTALEGLESIRKRPGMYVGGNGPSALAHLHHEIFDNGVDEALAGYCTRLEVTLHKDGSVEISDNGRGIPVDINKKLGESGVKIAYTRLHAGGKFGGSGYKVSGGLHGVGAAVVNALSERVDVIVHREGSEHKLSFKRGTPGLFETDKVDSQFKEIKDIQQIGKSPKNFTGTTVRFWPDYALFTPGALIERDTILERARRTAFLVPSLTINIRDLREETLFEETFHFEGGIRDMVDYMSNGKAITDVSYLTGEGVFTETIPVLDENGNLENREVERIVEVEVAFRWDNGYDNNTASFVNVVTTPKGGTHLKGFERAILNTIRKAYEGTRLMKQTEDPPTMEDITEGLTAVISISVPEPQFVGQTKEELGTSGVTKVVQDVVTNGLKLWLDSSKTKNQARLVLEKIANAARNRVASRSQREAARRKTALEGASMPAKLVDCRAIGVDRSEIFLVEGDSALGSARQGRNSEYQALLPLRGKILNVQKASMADMLKNAECAAIIQCVGAGSGKTFDLEQMRYGRIMIMADADVDGSHIRSLLIVLFAKYMREVIEDGRLYAAMPPLHKIEVMGKGGETIYTYTQEEMENTVKELETQGKKIKTPVARFKGLGEMDAEELWETTMDPSTRSVRKITIEDISEAENILELLFGDEVAPRRDWIIANSHRVDRESIDV